MWFQRNMVSNECGLKWMWSQMNRSQMNSSQMNVVSNERGLKWSRSQRNVVSNEWLQMNGCKWMVSNERGLKWTWSQMNVVSNERGLKWTWSQMNVVSNEPGLKCSGASRVWQAWHVPWAPLWRGAQKLLGKTQNLFYSFLNLYFAPHAFINCKAASTPRPYLQH